MVRYRDGEVKEKGFLDDYAFFYGDILNYIKAHLNWNI